MARPATTIKGGPPKGGSGVPVKAKAGSKRAQKGPAKQGPKAKPKPKPKPKPKQIEKRSRGRPSIPIDKVELGKLASINCTIKQAAAWLDMGETTLRDRLRRSTKLRELWINGKEKGRVGIRQNLYNLAKRNVAAAIFLAKNELGMIDERSMVHAGDPERPISHTIGHDLSLLSKQQVKALRHLLKASAIEVEEEISVDDEIGD